MNRLRMVVMAFGLALLTACSSYSVKTDYDPTTSVGGGYGFGRRHWSYGVGTRFSSSQVHKYREGTIVLEVVDSKSNQLVWQGAAEGALTGLDNPEDAQEQINKAVRDLLANFPPNLKR